MSAGNVTFPFTAFSGLDDPKTALLCALTNPNIRTVLIRGRKGTGKTALARSCGPISGKTVVNIPMNVSSEQLFGGMDVDAAINDGIIRMEKGIVSRGDGNILYIDDINLMDQGLLVSLLDCIHNGRVVLESEGISDSYDCDTVLIATMNPEESDVSSHVLDRFDLCAYTSPEDVDRRDLLVNNSEFMDDGHSFMESHRADTDAVNERISRAMGILPLVTISDELMDVCVELCLHVGAHGSRGDISMVVTSMTLAALEGRDEVTRSDIERAARLCLVHRRDYTPPPPEQEPQQPEPEDDREDESQPPENDDQSDENDKDDREDDRDDDMFNDLSQMLEDMVFEIGEEFRIIDYLKDANRRVTSTSSRKGRREVAISNDSSGRYVRSRIPDGRVRDIAFDATIRAAAPYQRSRDPNGLSFSIHSQDIREKVRERKSGCTILFLVDASGSLGVRKRMSAVKGAVISMLKDSYVRRDRIGLMEFRRDSAEVILPPTRSVEYSFKLLEELPTGGRTPLGEALIKVSEYMGAYIRSHKGERCYVVLITDGHANVSVQSGTDATEEARRIASDMHVPGLGWVVIDASTKYSNINDAEMLAAELGGTYLRLESLDADRIADNIRSILR